MLPLGLLYLKRKVPEKVKLSTGCSNLKGNEHSECSRRDLNPSLCLERAK